MQAAPERSAGARNAAIAAGTALARWPAITLAAEQFVVHLSIHPEAWQGASTHGESVFLVWACARGDAAALGTLEREFVAPARHALGRLRLPDDVADEVTQRARERLLVGTAGRTPRISEYRGVGSLRRWLQVVLVREALMWMRENHQREVTLPLNEAASESDAEIAYLRRAYAVHFQAAFADALAALTSRQRNLLRYCLVHRMNSTQIGRVYGVHRATAFRWLQQTRSLFIRHTRSCLATRLDLPQAQLSSVLRLFSSRAPVSLLAPLGERLSRESQSSAALR